MKTLRSLTPAKLLRWGALSLSISLVPLAGAKNPIVHVDVKVVSSYKGQQPLPKPERVLVYDFTVASNAVKTDPMPGIRQRIHNAGSSDDAKTQAARQTQDEITSDMVKELQKRLKESGIPVEKGAAGQPPPANSLAVQGTISKLDEGHRLRRETVGLGAGASDVNTDCQISIQTANGPVLVSDLTTVAESGKKPGVAVTMGAGAAPAVAAGVTGATAHKSTAQGDSARTGSAIAKHVAAVMKAQGWIGGGDEKASSDPGKP